MTEVRRKLLWKAPRDDWWHSRVEFAVRSDGSSPALGWWSQMSKGAWASDPAFTSPPDSEQLHDVAKLLAETRYIGEFGYPSNGHAVNDLDDGIWEFKLGAHRLAYFDTPGDGTYSPKLRRTGDDIPVDEGDVTYPWYPSMDEILRLTNGFAKTAQMAPPEAVSTAIKVREEDVIHDR